MSSSNVTEFYGLTQYVGSDKPSFTDNNEAFRAIDSALHGAVADVADASDAITTLTGRVGDVEEAVTGLSGTVGTQGDAITALQNKEISQDRDIADVKAAALDMVCAFNEEAAQSVHAYAIGDFFKYNDVLYKASAVINIGDTIIPNTNCVATNVSAELLTLEGVTSDLQPKEDNTLETTSKEVVGAINELNLELSGIDTVAGYTCTNSANLASGLVGGWHNSKMLEIYLETTFNSSITDYADVSGDRLFTIASVAGNLFNLESSTLAQGYTNKKLIGIINANSLITASDSRMNNAMSVYAGFDGTNTYFFTHTAVTWFDTFRLLEMNGSITCFKK